MIISESSNSPYINRFLSADTVVAGYANPQALNRFSYVLNNPLLYTDPTGHWADNGYVGNHGPLNCKKYSEYCNNGKPKSADELAKMRNERDEKEKEKSDEKKNRDILRRSAEFAFGATLFGVGAIVTIGGFFVLGAAAVEVVGGIPTGPGEFLAAAHAVAVGSVALFVVIPVGVTSMVNGYKTMKDALVP